VLPPLFNELILVRTRRFPHFLERKWDVERDPEYLEKLGNYKVKTDGYRDPFDENESMFSLSMILKRNLSFNKTSNNTRIVVV
jgi:hypothetical protein